MLRSDSSPRFQLATVRLGLLIGVLCCACCSPAAANDSPPTRVQEGLVAIFDFTQAETDRFSNLAASGLPVSLRIAEPRAANVSAAGLEITGKTMVRSEGAAGRLNEALRQSPGLTLEAWIRPARLDQTGPARIVTISRDSGERNLTLGQDGDKFEVRLRTTRTSSNGIPALASKSQSLRTEWMHVVYTFEVGGQGRIYLNGELNAEQNIGGDLSNWNKDFALAIGNELSADRPWSGGLKLVALYGRPLSAGEVSRNFRAGSSLAPPTPEELLARQLAENGKLFEKRIAPLLSRHCLECHDSVTRNGLLDLSKRTAALEGGESGIAFQPGRAAESLLWTKVESDEMPHDRPPLAAAEKQLLKAWLDGGGVWSLPEIDPAVYAHGEGGGKVFVQRLTVPEYIETVRAILGVDISAEAREILPRDLRADGFNNTAYNLNVDLGHVEAYARLAELIVSRIDLPALARQFTGSRELSDENMTKIIEPLGKRLLRAPLRKDDVIRYCGISTTVAAAGGSFEEATGYIIEAMLQSPRFLYRIEQQSGDGTPRPLGSYELASRLSYIICGAPPDAALLQAADKGELDRAGVEAHARRLLQDPRAVTRSKQFVTEWLQLDRLDSLRPQPEKFPHWQPELAADMRAETLAYFEEIAWKQQRPLHELLNAQLTFTTRRLARHYGLPAEQLPEDNQLVRMDLSQIPARGGLLTHGSLLTVGGDDASMVSRGLFIMHELLRGVVRDPPPCVDTKPVPSRPGLTQRAIAETRIANQSCVGCHAKFEPLAFGLEKFDGLGSFHQRDEFGNELRDDGQILIPGQANPLKYRSSQELMNLLAESERVRETFTWKLTQFALGRPLDAEDVPQVHAIHQKSQAEGGTYSSLLLAIVTSDLVLQTRTENNDPLARHQPLE